jgi:hypothetical protein
MAVKAAMSPHRALKRTALRAHLILRTSRPILAIACLFLCQASCHKTAPTCTGHCADVLFAGTVFDGSTNQPLPNQKVTINLYKNGLCFTCATYSYGTPTTNTAGQWLKESSLDTMLMADHHFEVFMKPPKNYLLYASLTGPGLQPNDFAVDSFFYKLDSNAMRNIHFVFYRATSLNVNLHRTGAITHDPTLFLDFTINNHISTWSIEQTTANKDTTLILTTAANIYTVVRSSKFLTDSTHTANYDSVLCSSTGRNAVDIYY